MKTKVTLKSAGAAALAAAALFSQAAMADYGRSARHLANTEYAYARVLDVKPLIRTVEVEIPVRECYDREVVETRRGGNDVGRTIAGGIIGGVIGRQFGSGSGRDAMTVLGTVIGAASASDGNGGTRHQEVRTQRFCETRYEYEQRERVEGYRVTYKYHGQTYTTRTQNDPGDRIRVRVSVQPLTR